MNEVIEARIKYVNDKRLEMRLEGDRKEVSEI
jgi:hypothetical protein